MRQRFLVALSAMLVLLGSAGSALAATITNGGFESGNLNGWTVERQGTLAGNWYAYSGTASPVFGIVIQAPPEGTYAATAEQGNPGDTQGSPGSHVLYQDITLEPAMAHSLSFVVYYQNFAGAFFAPDTLTVDPTGVIPNQQYRVDLIKSTADPFSVAPADVLANLFETNPGDPLTLAPTTKNFDLTAYAGQTVRLRFAEVDNQNFLLASVDNVRVTSVTSGGGGQPGATPELSSIALFGSGFLGLVGLAVARARRRLA